jgi:CheY-like chemotaxis protein
VEQDGLSAAIMDFGLGDGDGDTLCARLNRRGIPYVLHSGYSHTGEACRSGISVPKPATPDALVAALASALSPGQSLQHKTES